MKKNNMFLPSPKELCVPVPRLAYAGETTQTLAGDHRTALLPS